MHTKKGQTTHLPANITDTDTKYYELGWMEGGNEGETASFIVVYVN